MYVATYAYGFATNQWKAAVSPDYDDREERDEDENDATDDGHRPYCKKTTLTTCYSSWRHVSYT